MFSLKGLVRGACVGLALGGAWQSRAEAQWVVPVVPVVAVPVIPIAPPTDMLSGLPRLEAQAMQHASAWGEYRTNPGIPVVQVEVTITRLHETHGGLPVYEMVGPEAVLADRSSVGLALQRSKIGVACSKAGWLDVHFVQVTEQSGHVIAMDPRGVERKLAWLKLRHEGE